MYQTRKWQDKQMRHVLPTVPKIIQTGRKIKFTIFGIVSMNTASVIFVLRLSEEIASTDMSMSSLGSDSMVKLFRKHIWTSATNANNVYSCYVSCI